MNLHAALLFICVWNGLEVTSLFVCVRNNVNAGNAYLYSHRAEGGNLWDT